MAALDTINIKCGDDASSGKSDDNCPMIAAAVMPPNINTNDLLNSPDTKYINNNKYIDDELPDEEVILLALQTNHRLINDLNMELTKMAARLANNEVKLLAIESRVEKIESDENNYSCGIWSAITRWFCGE